MGRTSGSVSAEILLSTPAHAVGTHIKLSGGGSDSGNVMATVLSSLLTMLSQKWVIQQSLY
jgi:hypothetical protein